MKKQSALRKTVHLVACAAAVSAGVLTAPLSRAADAPASASQNYRLTPAPKVFSLPGVAAQVNGVDIPTEQLWNRVIASAGSAALTGLVDEVLIEQEATKRLGLSSKRTRNKIEDQVSKRFSDFKKQFKDDAAFQKQLKDAAVTPDDVRRQMRLDLYKEKLLDDRVKVSSDEVRKYFEENRQKLSSPEQIRLKHILVATEQEAKDLVVSLKAGANFETLAGVKSLDKGTRANGGDLGLFSPGMLIPAIQDKAFALPVGGIDIARTALGFHVLKVTERKAAKPAVLDQEMRGNIERALKQAKFSQVYAQWIQGLRGKAQIKVLLNP